METRVILPDSKPAQSIKEVVTALRSQKLKPRHEKKTWGDWIYLDRAETVVAIESIRGMATSATIESTESEWEINQKVLTAFARLGWMGEDDEGPYPL